MTTTREAELELEVMRLRNFISYAPVSSGVCCCGDSMDRHASAMSCGHSPVDLWDYSVACFLESKPQTSALPALIEKVEKLTIERCAEVCEEYQGSAQTSAKAIRSLTTGNIDINEVMK